MKIIRPGCELIDPINREEILKKIERIGRVCYRSEDKITENSALAFVGRLIKSGHESVLEHSSISVRVICDRGVSHEIVRHRIASYSQESTRYCNYSKDKFDNQLTFVKPCFWAEEQEAYKMWEDAMQKVEQTYFQLISTGAAPEQARSILPNSLKTEIVMTMNLREWRHFFRLRTSKSAHPQMREVSNMILHEFLNTIPEIVAGIADNT